MHLLADRTKATYARLRQPPFSPPPWLFGPVWTALYATMGYAAHRAWTAGHSSLANSTLTPNAAALNALTKQGATLYSIQLALNLIWMPLWFGALQPIPATIDLVLLTGTVSYLASVWGQVDKVAAYCMVPYLGWLGLATYLSAGTGYLNNWDFKTDVKTEQKKQ